MKESASPPSKLLIAYKNDEPITNTDSKNELDFLKNYIKLDNFELKVVIYFINALPISTELLDICFEVLNKRQNKMYNLFKIDVIKRMNEEVKRYVPIGKPLVEIILSCFNESNEKNDNKPKLSDKNKSKPIKDAKLGLKVSSDIVNSKEFNEKCIKKATRLLYKHLDNWSNTISFPELVYYIIEKLDFNDMKDLVHRLKEHKIYIENERSKLRKIDEKSMREFRKSVLRLSELKKDK